ncbi:class I SAM-dependent methyltransferase [Brevundimonas sp. Root1423]|uniref:class I SAM-dependent methyltransferase n=1 Tax=Brevundimonas sp. Root1423 TaxID=1736462 RepID=UPI0006F1F7C2|nr:class I SAM-dependent methyltransferase [Brevundimonas sp. Root1423]KQY89971.1 methyltransferase [Brevundimonas sp. Root1423]
MAESVERRQGQMSRRGLLSGVAVLAVAGLAGCGREEKTAEPPATPDGPPKGSLEWAVAGPWRAQDKARDAARHPMETLRFFGLQPRMTVVEFWPGSGWYTEILAPYLAEGAGKYVAAGFQTGPGADPSQVQLAAAFQQRFTTDERLYGEIELSAFGPTSGPVTAAGTADMVLFMRNIHAWMAAGIAEKAFADAWAALRPGGVLGVEQHRLGPEEAAEAGFAFVAASEINANERDTKDHPFGVETLPPSSLTAARGSPPNPAFDRSKYDRIGESDRMTLRFRKPE